MTSTASTPDASGLLPGGYPGTPQHEQPVDENATNELGDYLQKIKQSLPSFPLNLNADDYNAESKDNTGNGADSESKNLEKNDTENNDSENYIGKYTESLPSFPLKFNANDNAAENEDNTGNSADREPKNMDENNAENYDTSYYVEKIKESLPSVPLFGTGNNVEDNAENKDNTESDAENKEPRSIEDNKEEKDSGNYVEKIKESLPSNPLMSNTDNVAEDKESGNSYVEKFKESLPSIPFMSNTDNNVAEDKESENKDSGNYLEKIKEPLPSFIPLFGTGENKDNTENGVENKDSGNYVGKIKESLPTIPFVSNTDNNVAEESENKDSVEESLPSIPSMSNTDNNVAEESENKDSGNYVGKFKESLPSISSTDNNVAEDKESENKDSGNYVEKFEESLPSIPSMSNTDNNAAEDKESENKDSVEESLPSIPLMSNTDNNVAEDKESENKDSGNYVEESLPSNPLMSNTDNVAEDKESGNSYMEKFKESLPSNPFMSNTDNDVAEDKESENIGNSSENKDSRTYMEKIMGSLPSFPTFIGESGPDAKAENVENKAENNAEKSSDDKIREEFPLRYEPNPSEKVTDDNNLTKATNKGSSALGGVGINPAAITGLFRSQSPRHPYYQEHPPEAEEKTDKTDTSHTHGTADQYQTSFDLTGDYNKQKEQEQIAEHKAKSAQQEQEQIAEHKAKSAQDELDHKQKSEGKKPVKPERIDLGVQPLDLGIKPLGDQQPPPLPYRPEGDPDHIKQSPSKGHSQEDLGPKITKKDKVNATVGKAVGTIKQKIGKIVKSDSLTAKGTEERAEAHKTKEFAELQKQAKEF